MICLLYKDELERTMVLCSISRRCRELDARLVFIGSEASCECARKNLLRDGACAQQHIHFVTLLHSVKETFRSALLETNEIDGHVVAWIEAPPLQQTKAIGKELRLLQSSRTMSDRTLLALFSAYPMKVVQDGSLQHLLEVQDVLARANALLPHCPSRFIGPCGDPPTAPVNDASMHTKESDPGNTNALQSRDRRSLELITAGIAHELGNPLSIISSSIQYLHDKLTARNDPTSEFTMTALQNVDRIHELLRRMKDFCTSRQSPICRADLNEVLSEVLRSTSTECKRRAVNLEVALDPQMPRAWVDKSGVKQILLNLIRNAFEATGEDGRRLLVRTRATTERKGVIIEVENSGSPIQDEVLPLIFRPFFTTKESGTGLGLYLSRQIARDNGGDLSVENLPGGVRFSLTLSLSRRKENCDGACHDRRR